MLELGVKVEQQSEQEQPATEAEEKQIITEEPEVKEESV